MSRDFLLLVFSWISFPKYTIRAVLNFFENSRRYLQLKVDHRYQRHRTGVKFCHPFHWSFWYWWQNCHRCQRYQWQTMGLISGCRYLKVNLKAKIYTYVNSTIQRCPNKIIKIFLIEDFFHLPLVSTTPVVNLELRISPRIFEKMRNGPNGILWGWGETDSWKKTRSKKSRDNFPLLTSKFTLTSQSHFMLILFDSVRWMSILSTPRSVNAFKE